MARVLNRLDKVERERDALKAAQPTKSDSECADPVRGRTDQAIAAHVEERLRPWRGTWKARARRLLAGEEEK